MTGGRKHDLGGKPGRNMLAQLKRYREKGDRGKRSYTRQLFSNR